MTHQQKITAALKAVTKNDKVPSEDESLFDSGYLDSFALADLVAELEQEFGISIPDKDLNPRKFESIAKIESYIESRGA
jgi:acyl carrier protein